MSPSRPLPEVQLDDDRLSRGPWIYARRIRSVSEGIEDGDLVEVLDASERFVGHGLFNGRSDIALRMISRGRRTDLARPDQFLLARLKRADDLRRRALALPQVTDAYRVVHGEGDDLPGLVVDHLGDTLVVEHHALGFWRLRDTVEKALRQLYPERHVVHRIPAGARRAEGYDEQDLIEAEEAGTEREILVTEHGVRHPIRPGAGHKTGFFCDQRDNRRRIAELSAGKSVLDLCCNTGGFALHAARAGARTVTGVDLDEVVLERAEQGARENRLEVEWHHLDAFRYLRGAREAQQRHQLVVLDPPKLAHGRRDVDAALLKYA
ncbi:MAG: class I SAM-dependent methyltransferase, partial [Planctomycetota bacterium]